MPGLATKSMRSDTPRSTRDCASICSGGTFDSEMFHLDVVNALG